ncbi:DUF5677 domain-containing protein [Xanthomonas arboricola]|uniref:DUF5677 domain-containing protein n=1 Tax=Xanthomonas arboricola TaxID=56448 RepID=UPI000CED9BB7|nr:DUF5677 domain-containing protein [Xanthomonas arboricola]MBB6572101.1 hypothetical protein [Xanthomonas arboricola]PPT84467.1 hypothetical protein XarbCFBP8149_19435 [Xanthomonas arboricola]
MADADLLLPQLLAVEVETRERCVVDLETDGTYSNVLKGCFVKSFEYAVICRSFGPSKPAFFFAPTLRGICEDFIALRYLQAKRTPAERDDLLKNKMMSLVFDGAAKQLKFFQKRRPFQPVFSGQPKSPLPKASLPPTRNMAVELGLDDLYDFLYAITSDVVHFNPRVIIRNAWGDTKKRVQHSVGNFDAYYADFCQTYSLFFLCEFVRTFSVELSFSGEYLKSIVKLEEWLAEKLRWPEAVTFEEMNIDGPAEILRLLMKMAWRNGVRFT